MEINKSKPVMVTGATGYVAGWLVKKLLEKGFTVHAAVRSPDNKQKTAHLDAIASKSKGRIKYFKADLLKEGSYAEAMKGCELVFHTASPFVTDVKNPQKELIEPAENGTANVLNTANATESVRRVVVTSSCAAIYTDAIDTHHVSGGRITENDWNTTASLDYQPYSYSKTLAEKKAWEIVNGQNRWDLVTINPAFVMGPPLNPKSTASESMTILKQMGDGTFKMGAPKIGVGVVDVRDVAEAHYRAGFTPSAKGRYITFAHETNFLEMGAALLPKFGDKYPLPKSATPKWLLTLIGPFVNKLLTRQYVKSNVNIEWKGDNSKIKRELAMSFRPLQQTMEDGFQVLVDKNLV